MTATQPFIDGVMEHAAEMDNVRRISGGDAVAYGMVPSQHGGGANMSVDITAGWYSIYGVIYTYAGGTQTINASNATKNRYDIIYFTSGGIQYTAGTPAAGTDVDPIFMPDLPANSVLVAAVYVAAGVTTITDSVIRDERILMRVPGVIVAASDVTADSVTPDSTWRTPTNKTVTFGAGILKIGDKIRVTTRITAGTHAATTRILFAGVNTLGTTPTSVVSHYVQVWDIVIVSTTTASYYRHVQSNSGATGLVSTNSASVSFEVGDLALTDISANATTLAFQVSQAAGGTNTEDFWSVEIVRLIN